jgi:formylglycine-generating enzyme required for sulfatase activity
MLELCCPSCRSRLQVRPESVDSHVRCPRCQTALKVHAPTQTPDSPPSSAALAAAWAPLLSPPQGGGELGRLGGHRIWNVLGAGGMGVVFRASDPVLDREVAIKVMRPEVANSTHRLRFLREARATAQVEHENVVAIHQVGEERGVPFIVMPLLCGESLQTRLARERRLTPAEATRIGREIALGLAAAHEKGVVHRDVKPANVWLEGAQRRVKILDFGLALSADVRLHTQPGALLGTPGYLAPEQARGLRVDSRADLFALGCVLYEMLAGRAPFQGADVYEILHAVVSLEPEPIARACPDAPPALGELVAQLLAKRAEDRPAGAAEAARRLSPAPAEAARPTPPPEMTAAPKAAGPRGRFGKRGLFVAGVVLAVVVAISSLVWLWPKPHLDGGLLSGLSGPAPPEAPAEPPPGAPGRNGIGMRFARIPAGSFVRKDKKTVQITHDFHLGVYEVTQREWKAIMETNPSHFRKGGLGEASLKGREGRAIEDTDEFPVECVSHDDATAFLARFNKREEATRGAWEYRLPTEAQWEYACRGGTVTAFHFGDKCSAQDANCDCSVDRTCKVGSYPPNAYGLHDMHGNVQEWCADWYDPTYYARGPTRDPLGPPYHDGNRVFRGGCWNIAFGGSADRFCTRWDTRQNNLGFRVALVPARREPGK